MLGVSTTIKTVLGPLAILDSGVIGMTDETLVKTMRQFSWFIFGSTRIFVQDDITFFGKVQCSAGDSLYLGVLSQHFVKMKIPRPGNCSKSHFNTRGWIAFFASRAFDQILGGEMRDIQNKHNWGSEPTRAFQPNCQQLASWGSQEDICTKRLFSFRHPISRLKHLLGRKHFGRFRQ